MTSKQPNILNPPDYLVLREICLKPAEEWSRRGNGLTFLFGRSGAGTYRSSKMSKALRAGEVLVFEGCDGRLRADQPEPMAFATFTLTLEHLLPLFADKEIGLLYLIGSIFREGKFYSARAALAQACHDLLAGVAPRLDLEHRSQVLQLAAMVISAELMTLPSPRPRVGWSQERLQQVLGEMTSAELMASTVSQLANRIGWDAGQFHREGLTRAVDLS